MKRVIIDLQDDYASCLAITAVGMVQNTFGGSQLNVRGWAVDLHDKESVHLEQYKDSNGNSMFMEVE